MCKIYTPLYSFLNKTCRNKDRIKTDKQRTVSESVDWIDLD